MERGMRGRGAARCCAALLAALVLAAGLGGCIGLGMSGEEVELLEASTADARFVERMWTELSPGERRDFARQNALRWGYFNDLAHGRPAAVPPSSAGAEEDSDE